MFIEQNNGCARYKFLWISLRPRQNNNVKWPNFGSSKEREQRRQIFQIFFSSNLTLHVLPIQFRNSLIVDNKHNDFWVSRDS